MYPAEPRVSPLLALAWTHYYRGRGPRIFRCPRYDKERCDFHNVMSGTSMTELTADRNSEQIVSALVSSTDPQLWSEIGRLSARIRQSRRRLRAEFQLRVAKLNKKSFATRRAAWKSTGKVVRRYGVFFAEKSKDFRCPCMASAGQDIQAWTEAR